MEKETVEMPCLECGKMKKVKVGSYEHTGVFNVFCGDPESDCEDKYAFKQ